MRNPFLDPLPIREEKIKIKRDKVVSIRFTKAEWELVKHSSKALGLKNARFIRERALGRRYQQSFKGNAQILFMINNFLNRSDPDNGSIELLEKIKRIINGNSYGQ